MAKSNCKTCGTLGDHHVADKGPPKWESQLPAAAAKLKEISRDVRRCPNCKAFFSYEDEGDPHGYMGESTEELRRITDRAALDLLLAGNYDGPLLEELESELG